jgi:sodium/potassium-transporting ATPase subunit alpha
MATNAPQESTVSTFYADLTKGFQSNEAGIFQKVDRYVKSLKADKQAKGSMKDAADNAEAIRTWQDHMWPLEQLEKELETSRLKGLSTVLANKIHGNVGDNALTERNKVPWYVVFLKEQTGFFSLLLWLGSALCFIAYIMENLKAEEGDYIDPSNLYLGIVLATVVFITGVFSYLQTSKAASLMDDFKNFIPKVCQVIRDGAKKEIESATLVPGDIVEVKGGDQVPADLILFATNEMKVNNASLTGEAEELLR